MIKPCEMKIKKLTKFQIHRWTEVGKKNFKCLVCGLLHHTDNAMYLHMLWKHPEKKFIKCRLCKKYIDSAIGKQVHFDECHKGEISTSLKTKVLKCQLCDKIFIGQGRKYQRSQHLKANHSDTAVRCAWFSCCR
jgi:transcription elongation factor Elf1